MTEIFDHYKPSREVELKTEDGGTEELLLKFNSLKDFSKDGIIDQSQILKDLQDKENIYSRMLDVLKNNVNLQTVLSNDEHKNEFVELLDTLIQELTEND